MWGATVDAYNDEHFVNFQISFVVCRLSVCSDGVIFVAAVKNCNLNLIFISKNGIKCTLYVKVGSGSLFKIELLFSLIGLMFFMYKLLFFIGFYFV
ncbi:hypothetical protein A9264_12195 [Vibrio sp. UCD-FRSSP16_10]|nr:hypothetical protein A9260_12410 [Vibrio sp. UCD-FRSSP16_30]OBT21100.1 hypothetical protein A9264_12195 [Vibrio sp. UCD-FRSSP16_10]